MEEQQAVLSKSEKGKVRIDYFSGGKKRTILFEPVFDGMIETAFDGDGVMTRELFHKSKDSAQKFAETFMKEQKIGKVTENTYSEVRIMKNCPICGNDTLSRIAGTAPDSTKTPIMPLYRCSNCHKESYYLSDAYLDYLVTNNRAMFKAEELKELDADKGKFMTELKEYIIRIFASKKITRIE